MGPDRPDVSMGSTSDVQAMTVVSMGDGGQTLPVV